MTTQSKELREEEVICPDCGGPLKDDFHGYAACFCRWNGRRPTANQIITMADDEEAASHHN